MVVMRRAPADPAGAALATFERPSDVRGARAHGRGPLLDSARARWTCSNSAFISIARRRCSSLTASTALPSRSKRTAPLMEKHVEIAK